MARSGCSPLATAAPGLSALVFVKEFVGDEFAGPAGGYRFYELEATGEGLTWAELTSSGSGPRC